MLLFLDDEDIVMWRRGMCRETIKIVVNLIMGLLNGRWEIVNGNVVLSGVSKLQQRMERGSLACDLFISKL